MFVNQNCDDSDPRQQVFFLLEFRGDSDVRKSPQENLVSSHRTLFGTHTPHIGLNESDAHAGRPNQNQSTQEPYEDPRPETMQWIEMNLCHNTRKNGGYYNAAVDDGGIKTRR